MAKCRRWRSDRSLYHSGHRSLIFRVIFRLSFGLSVGWPGNAVKQYGQCIEGISYPISDCDKNFFFFVGGGGIKGASRLRSLPVGWRGESKTMYLRRSRTGLDSKICRLVVLIRGGRLSRATPIMMQDVRLSNTLLLSCHPLMEKKVR